LRSRLTLSGAPWPARGDKRFRLEGPLPQVGVGYRFELQPRANVRIDFATGVKSTAVYFNFQEAF
jgi:hypothetical protein